MKLLSLAATMIIISFSVAWGQPSCQWFSYISEDTIGYDSAKDLSVDTHGNIYVAGSSTVQENYRADYAAAKFDSAGNVLWKSFFDNNGYNDMAHSIAWDEIGNAYVTGVSGYSAGDAVITIKYDTLGHQEWVAMQSGQQGSNPENKEVDITCDSQGNTYVCFTDRHWGPPHFEYMTVVNYSSSGELLNIVQLDGGAVASGRAIILRDTILYVVGAVSISDAIDANNLYLVKLNVNCDTIWTRQFDAADNIYDYGSVIDVDTEGNIIIGGATCDEAFGWAPLIVKYDSDGNLLWYDIIPCNSFSSSSSVRCDSLGNVYWHGTYNERPIWRGTNFFITKYNADGEQQWFNTFNDGRTAYDYHSDMTIDRSGNAFVGCTALYGENTEATVIKYLTSGDLDWITTYDSPGVGQDACGEIEIDDIGNLYIAATVDTDPDPSDSIRIEENYDILVAKFVQEPTGLEPGADQLPGNFVLRQNYPNPFNAQTTISYSLPETGPITLTIYNLLGQKVATLLDGVQTTGEHCVVWKAEELNSGMYIVKLLYGTSAAQRKITIVK